MLLKLSKMQISLSILFAVCSFIFLGCASTSKQDEGAVIGAVIGGVLGSELGDKDSRGERNTKILLGALIGGAIGSKIGEYMDDTDRLKAGQVLETNRSGVGTTWVNPDSQYKYTMTPTKTYSSDSGPCREYTTEAVIGGKVETIYGTACRQNDGSWQVDN